MRLPILYVSLMAFVLSCQSTKSSQPKITHGLEEQGFPYVVQIKINSRSVCTGSFLNDSLLLTAAHCVDRAITVSYGEVVVYSSNIAIHPQWPSGGESCKLPRNPRYDLAVVEFPKGTYSGSEYGDLSTIAAKANEQIKIVGYGNSQIMPFDRFCFIPRAKGEDGKCHVKVANTMNGVDYDADTILKFPPEAMPVEKGCPIDCSENNMKEILASSGQDFKEFVASKCAGNFRDRSYKETGVGFKRSGVNSLTTAANGILTFEGGLGGDASGINSASGAGDSGGPLFVLRNDKWLIAGVTHGGNLVNIDDMPMKKSIYVDLVDEGNKQWLARTLGK